MRRIASALATRRSDKPDTPNDAHPRPISKSFANSSTRRFFGTLTRITVSTDRSSPLPTASEPAHSSSASSTGSVSLRTPEDDRMGQLAPHVARSSSSRKAWIPWLTPKKSDPQGQLPSLPPSSYWLDSSGPIPPSSTAVNNQPTESDDDTSDESSSSSESDSPSTSPVPSRVDQSGPRLSPVDFVVSLTMNNIPPVFSPPPLLHYSNAPLFPRSSNSVHRLSFCDTIESTMHRKRLLHRLQSNPADRRLLAAFGPRVSSAAQRRTLLQPEEGERYDLKHVRPFSLGLKQWIARPYFEERTVLWVPDDAGTVAWTTVKGSGFGVWALDVPESLELLAGLDNFDTDAAQPGSPLPPQSNNVAPELPSLPVSGKHVPYKAVPSPLRYDRGAFEPPTSPASTELMTPVSTSTVSSSRRGVRFAESVDIDKEDQVPLGYILRHRKRREEKALFIQQEHERRQHEEERHRHEAERQQWEQEKRQWQKERRALEEAQRQKQYTEEIAAARVRRESHNTLPSSQAREQDRRPREAYSRPVYDPRKQNEYSSQSHSLRSRNDSSSSSRQGSLPRSESGGPHTSHPTSTHSISSSEDVRARASRNSRRESMISEPSQRPPFFAYGWPPVPPISQIPPIPIFPSMQVIPVMPQFTMDMPLLPPAAPFMRQQYSRSRSRDSSPPKGVPSRGERPQRSSDPIPPKPRHNRSSSDEYGGRSSPARSHTQTNNSSTHSRSVYPKRPEASPRASMPSSTPKQPFTARRQTALS